jgi:hypothetical protein
MFGDNSEGQLGIYTNNVRICKNDNQMIPLECIDIALHERQLQKKVGGRWSLFKNSINIEVYFLYIEYCR